MIGNFNNKTVGTSKKQFVYTRGHEAKGGTARQGDVSKLARRPLRGCLIDSATMQKDLSLCARCAWSGASPPLLASSLGSNDQFRDDRRNYFPRTEKEASLCRNDSAMISNLRHPVIATKRGANSFHWQHYRGATRVP